MWRKLRGSGLALCVLGLSRDFLVSTTIIEEGWGKPCGFTPQNIRFSNCPCFQGKNINEKKNLSECIWTVFKIVWLDQSTVKKGSHMAMRENTRLRLLTIKWSTMHEGVRYFNPPLSPTASRDNPPACPAHRGVFASVLFVVLDILCEDVPDWGFSCFTFQNLQRRRAETLPHWLGEAGVLCFERWHVLLGELQKLPKKHLRCVCVIAYCTSLD